MITDCLQGELEVVTLAGSGKAREAGADAVDRVPFLMLGALRLLCMLWCALRCAGRSTPGLRKRAGPAPRARWPRGLLCTCRSPAGTTPAGLDLPAAPLFKDALEKVIIPQVSARTERWEGGGGERPDFEFDWVLGLRVCAGAWQR